MTGMSPSIERAEENREDSKEPEGCVRLPLPVAFGAAQAEFLAPAALQMVLSLLTHTCVDPGQTHSPSVVACCICTLG